MFTPTPDALVEISAMLRVLKLEAGDNKALITKVHQAEHTFILTPADCRHFAAVLLKDLPEATDGDDEIFRRVGKSQVAEALHHEKNGCPLEK